MKTIKYFILITILAVLVSSCDNFVGLGSKLDLDGPIVEITAPIPRKAVSYYFTLEGTVADKDLRSDIRELQVTAKFFNEELNIVDDFPKQWRYTNKKNWEVSENSGASWFEYTDPGLEWEGTKDVTWKLPIDLTVNGSQPYDGEYVFTVIAKDTAGMSDDNSIKTRVLIIDRDPPKVDIINPVLYRGRNALNDPDVKILHDIEDDNDIRFEPSNIGRFLTQGFNVKWQVEDNHDVKSVEFIFYKHDEEIDGDASTPLPVNYIYRYFENLPPFIEDEKNSIKPNGDFTVPALDGNIKGFYDGELKSPITEKTTVLVATKCYDTAGNPNQEKVIGYFIYWPKADEPWILYTDGMKTPEHYLGQVGANDLETYLKENAFMIYPGRTIKANAYHNHGITKIVYSLYAFDTVTRAIHDNPVSDEFDKMEMPNAPRPNGTYSTVFPWEFKPPARSGFFVVKARAYSISGRESDEYVSLFRVQDISFPDFPEPIKPNASEPLFMNVDISANTLTIHGIVRDATRVDTLDMVWINPESAGFATQNQIRFFREPDFEGWQKIDELTNKVLSTALTQNSAYIEEDVLESEAILNNAHPTGIKHPNKIWRLALTWKEEDADTRQVFAFSITINLDDFNIGLSKQPLKSQVFLFKAKNPDNRTTIITYAPQGDESPPVITIKDVTIGANKYFPQEFAMIPRFLGGETITINGEWTEDSAEFLPIGTYFTGNFKASINTIPLTNLTVSYDNPSAPSTKGTWTAVVNVFTGASGTGINANNLNDSLVIAADTKDFGGNVSEAGGSWLVESDDLRLIRISSNDDGTFRAGQTVTIFLEFSKAVQLLNSVTTPTLTLNSTGSGAAATAVYKPNTSQSTRQEFVYTVGANHGATRLNVTGITATPNTWNQANYPFTWARGSLETREEIRVTMNQGHDVNTPNPSSTPPVTIPSGRLYARQLPITESTSNADYQFTLAAGKNIRIDTTPPTIVSVENTISGTNPVHFSSGDIFIRVKFSEPVMIGTTAPQLQLRLYNNRTVTTSSNVDDVRVSDADITFKYTIQAGDTTGQDQITVTGITGGAITDLAGTAFVTTGFTARTIANRFINTLAPAVPTVRLFSTQVTAANATDANAITNTVGATTHYGRSNATNRTLSNVYHTDLFIAVESNNSSVTNANSFTGNNNLMESTGLEYSVVNSATRNWIKVATGNMNGAAFSGLLPGTYRLVARQINRAGIASAETSEITFNWDPGELITRISSTTANGTYTNVSGRNEIAITVFFRKNVSIAAGSTITLNARRGNENSDYNASNPVVTLTGAIVNNQNSITYTYTIPNGDNTPPNTNLDVTGINITAWDGTTPNNGVRNNLTSISHLLPAARLNGSKEFKVSTGNLSISTAPAFNDSVPGAVTGTANQASANYHGIREDDGSYWTTLQFTFNRNISKGDGEIVIRQNEANYRLPTVLTEAQYDRFRNIANFDTYYTKGTYGFNGTSSDTTPKYILQYRYNPQRGATSLFTGSTTAANGPDTDAIIPNAFHDDFRGAEEIKINVFSSSVTIDGATVRVRLSGANAPQVPGATYTVTIPAGFVQDELGNKSGNPNNSVNAQVYNNVTLSGAARPFVRIRKTQDTIATATAGANQPRLVATQPMYAFARIDSRTPDAIIRYNANTSTLAQGATISLTTGSDNNNNSNWTPANGPKADTTAAVPTTPTTPASSTAGTAYPATGPNYQIAIGNTDYQGLQWRIIARAFVTGTNAASSYETQEMAYRTVLTYVVRRENAAMDTQYGSESILADGDQVWIRGGDAVDSSSIPGFPLTWADTWSELANKRAGIRLMTKVQGDSLNHSAWRWVSWEINATAYVDFIRGRDDATTIAGTTWAASSAAVAWQYGPKQIAYQRAGWTSFKTSYPVYAGQHRICDAGWDHMGKGRINFSATLNPRPAITDTNNWATTATLNAR